MSKKNDGGIENDSFFIPFEMPGDCFFDHDRDGKLTGWETFERDAYHYNMAQKFEEAKKNNENSFTGKYKDYYAFDEIEIEPQKSVPHESGSGFADFLAAWGSAIILIGSFVITISTGSFLFLIVGLVLGLSILKASGNLK